MTLHPNKTTKQQNNKMVQEGHNAREGTGRDDSRRRSGASRRRGVGASRRRGSEASRRRRVERQQLREARALERECRRDPRVVEFLYEAWLEMQFLAYIEEMMQALAEAEELNLPEEQWTSGGHGK